MRHVEECTSRIPLHSHVLGPGQPGEGNKGTRLGNLRLVII